MNHQDGSDVGLYDGLMTTRSMRRFTEEPVTDDEIEAVLAAAVQAPSGGNIQPYRFLVVTDPVRKERIGAIYRRAYDRYEPAVLAAIGPVDDPDARVRHERNWAMCRATLAETIGTAPTMVLVLVPRIAMALRDDEGVMDVGSVYASVYPAVQNIVLATRALGLGTCVTTVFRIHEDEVRRVCAVPDRYEIAALLPIGHPVGTWGVAPRRPARSITSWNDFGESRP